MRNAKKPIVIQPHDSSYFELDDVSVIPDDNGETVSTLPDYTAHDDDYGESDYWFNYGVNDYSK